MPVSCGRPIAKQKNMDEFWNKLIDLGLDYSGAMDRFIGDKDLMRKFLVKYFESDDMAKLERAIAAGDFSEAFNVAHLLKGVSGNLGLVPIFKELSKIVQKIRENNFSEVPACYDKLKACHLSFNSAISEC